ncbi:MAG: hypothetical protein PHQ89_00100 [Bacilli bacterium]|nr:hypothetical protein [Bacilli bacterium]
MTIYTNEPFSSAKRISDRCVCGASAIVTGPEGYCNKCLNKRKDFLNNIIGEIFIGETSSTEFSILNVIENMRKKFTKERLCNLIDKFFVQHENEPFSQPYQDSSFLSTILREKHLISSEIFNSIKDVELKMPKSGLLNINNKIKKAYQNYLKSLLLMIETDKNKLENTEFSIMYEKKLANK